MPATFLNTLRACRRPLAALAVALVLVQTMLAGLAIVQAAAHAANPLDGAVICHGDGTPAPAGGTDPAGWHLSLCCAFCVSAAPSAALPAAVQLEQLPRLHRGLSAPVASDFIPIAARAVRAGFAQAPPRADGLS